MYIACKKCKYNHDGECNFYDMGSGNEIDMPCYREKELIKEASDNFLQAFVGVEGNEVCEHDKQKVLDKIRAEISALKSHHINDCYDDGFQACRANVLQIIDKYKSESEKENEIQR